MSSYRYAAFVRLFFILTCLALLKHSPVAAQDDEAADAAVFAELDINEDGLLSGKEVKTVQAFDANGDGRVTQEEFVAGREQERGVDPAVEDEKLFTERDISEDGFLSGKEKKGLEKYDGDADGEITHEEFLTGRSAERKGPPTTTIEAARKTAEERFATLDENEDGRLSGTEISDALQSYDANGDKRITKEEFVAAFIKSAGTRPKTGGKGDLAPVLAALKSMDPQPLLAECREDLQSQVDEPVLRFLLELLQSEHGEIVPPTKNEIDVQKVEQDGQTYTVTKATVNCDNGTIDCSVTSLDGQIVGFNVQSTAAERFNDLLYKAILNDKDFAFKLAEFYTPRCEAFIKLIHGGKDEAAFASFHPVIQEKLGLEKAQEFFANVRKTYGKFKSLELESVTTNLDENGNGKDFAIEFMLTTDKEPAVSEVTMQFDGLKAHIVAFAEEKSNPTDDDDDVPAPPKASDDDVPAPPKASDDDDVPAPPKFSDDE